MPKWVLSTLLIRKYFKFYLSPSSLIIKGVVRIDVRIICKEHLLQESRMLSDSKTKMPEINWTESALIYIDHGCQLHHYHFDVQQA